MGENDVRERNFGALYINDMRFDEKWGRSVWNEAQ